MTSWIAGKTKDTDERVKKMGINVSAKLKGRKKSAIHRTHIKDGVKHAWSQELYRKNHEIAIRNSHATSEYRTKASLSLTLAHADPTKYLLPSLNTPLVCYYCGDKINLAGVSSESVVFHSLDGNHENWNPTNKVSLHRCCHPKMHNEKKKTRKIVDWEKTK